MTLICRHGLLAGLAIIALAALGCGGSAPTAHVSGTVTIHGRPLPADAQGTVAFSPVGKDQAKAVSVEIVNGAYDSPNTPTGPVKAAFSIVQPTGPEYTTDRGVKARDMTNIVPEKASAGIDFEVEGSDTKDFNLE